MNNNEELNLKKKAYSICKDYLQGPWKDMSLQDLKFDALRGGLSNGLGLFRCSISDFINDKENYEAHDIPKEVLFRLYDSKQEDKEAIIREAVIFSMLSEKNLGPKLYGVFPGGRLEEYLPSRIYTWGDFPDFNICVAKEMAKTHLLQMPMAKTSVFVDNIYQWLEDFMEMSKAKTADYIPDIISNGEYKSEVDWLVGEIRKLNPDVVFCHNDLQGGNILLLNNFPQDSDRRIVFIDFEMAEYNYRSFDIGMYFTEQCFKYNATVSPYSFEANFGNFPTPEEQEKFIDAYVSQLKESSTNLNDDALLERKKNQILLELPILQLAPLLYWLIWCFKIACNPTSDFPFWEHGYSRWKFYKKLKGIIEEKKIKI